MLILLTSVVLFGRSDAPGDGDPTALASGSLDKSLTVALGSSPGTA
ncbi:MAG: hypothetical protein V3T24_12525 [Longimicrobiales bacterium]